MSTITEAVGSVTKIADAIGAVTRVTLDHCKGLQRHRIDIVTEQGHPLGFALVTPPHKVKYPKSRPRKVGLRVSYFLPGRKKVARWEFSTALGYEGEWEPTEELKVQRPEHWGVVIGDELVGFNLPQATAKRKARAFRESGIPNVKAVDLLA